ncbi:hypothetical protein E3N88_26886 [Mikania micrantha]|uniref:Uncharacterized protein n=1 Tax=Mikania micrantha TaxID=192012 RepID=A0A5N6MXT5_9ASTR|nr:hypothetical protein E3N88_26886 [Mikania micrantha]
MMLQPTMIVDIPTGEQAAVIDAPLAAKTSILSIFSTTYLSHIYSQAAAMLGGLWAHYYQRAAFGEEGVVMPHSTLGFIISTLLAIVQIKSQGLPGFPFQTHPQLIMFSVTNLLIYGLASVAEPVISAAGVDRSSVYAITAHLEKIGSLCILVASLASLFYF